MNGICGSLSAYINKKERTKDNQQYLEANLNVSALLTSFSTLNRIGRL